MSRSKALPTLIATCFVLSGCGGNSSAASSQSDDNGASTSQQGAKASTSQGMDSVALERAQDGHFYADAEINGTTIRFMVDTGATSVALTEEDAAAIGIEMAEEDFTERGSGVGGIVGLKPVVLDSLAIGDIEITNVDAVVAKSAMSISLLGQSWLSRLERMTVQGDQMVLR